MSEDPFKTQQHPVDPDQHTDPHEHETAVVPEIPEHHAHEHAHVHDEAPHDAKGKHEHAVETVETPAEAAMKRRIEQLEQEVAAQRQRAEAAEARLAEAEAYIYDLQMAVMVAEIAAEEHILETEQRLVQTQAELEAYISKLLLTEQTVEDLRTAVETDELTGVSNLKALNAALPRAEADPNQEIISFDANGFGKVNKIQEYGPVEGDKQIRRVAISIRLAALGYGIGVRNVFRRGGDEFVVIAPKGEVDYVTRNFEGERVSQGRMSIAEAIIRRAAELYRHRRYSGTYGDTMEPLETIISLSGTSGDTFADADSKLQAAKQKRKAALEKQFKG